MKKILITAYDINPYKGSEAGTGWNFVYQVSKKHIVTAITRENNQKNIERYINQYNIDTSTLHFVYYDLPYYLRFWKKGARGSLLYFYLWQMTLPIFLIIRKNTAFDLVHSLNFHADWAPSFLWLLGKPVVWGPINHHEPIPIEYIKDIYAFGEYFKDRFKFYFKLAIWNLDPFLYICKRKAKIILAGNRSVLKRLRLDDTRSVLFSQVGLDAPEGEEYVEDNSSFTVMIAGRMIPIKAMDLAVKSFASFIEQIDFEKGTVELVVVGDGHMMPSLKKLVVDCNIAGMVTFAGWVNKQQMSSYYGKSDVFLFPSHEGGGMVVVEAQSYGLPVVCFNNYGPGELVNSLSGIRIEYSNYEKSIIEFGKALKSLYLDRNYCKKLSVGALKSAKKNQWDVKGQALANIYASILSDLNT